MSAADTQSQQARLEAENLALRSRVAALESELVEVQARTDAVVAHWQERAYWLDRWHLDLNSLMRRRGAMEALGAVRVLRSFYRALKRARQRIGS
jgi:hypothetical protein